MKIIINKNNRNISIQLSEIRNVEINGIIDDEVSEQNCRSLDLDISDSESVKLILESGTWHAMYNIFKFVVG